VGSAAVAVFAVVVGLLVPSASKLSPEQVFREKGGFELRYRVSPRPSLCATDGMTAAEVVARVRTRLEALGVDHPWVSEGLRGTILVRLPLQADAAMLQAAREVLVRDGCLAFCLVDEEDRSLAAPRVAARVQAWLAEHHRQTGAVRVEDRPNGPPRLVAEDRSLLAEVAADLRARGLVPDDRALAIRGGREHGAQRPSYATELLKLPALTGEHVARAAVLVDDRRTPYVQLEFDHEGTRRLAELTGAHVHEHLAIVLGDSVASTPLIREAITGGRAKIALGDPASPERLLADARLLVVVLNAGGSLPPLVLASEELVPPAAP